VIQEYRCSRCKHLLFKASLKLLLTKQHDPDKASIEPKCPKCGLINRFCYEPKSEVNKTIEQS
jgi:phage FluMu protein Com